MVGEMVRVNLVLSKCEIILRRQVDLGLIIPPA